MEIKPLTMNKFPTKFQRNVVSDEESCHVMSCFVDLKHNTFYLIAIEIKSPWLWIASWTWNIHELDMKFKSITYKKYKEFFGWNNYGDIFKIMLQFCQPKKSITKVFILFNDNNQLNSLDSTIVIMNVNRNEFFSHKKNGNRSLLQ